MGTFKKQPNGKWRAQVCVKKNRKSKTCRTKSEAMAWIVQAEQELEAGPDHTIAQMFERYQETHSSRKKSAESEGKLCERLSALLGHHSLQRLSTDDLARWRDSRLQEVSSATVRREWNLLNHALNVAVREWGWLPVNPLSKLTRPAPSTPRSRVWTDHEVETLLVAAGWPDDTLQARVGDCLLFALETAMRAGEICGVRPEHVRTKWVHIPKTKNGSARDVPLSKKAREILDRVGNDFGINTNQLDALFRKARGRAGLGDADIVFHDSRRTATTRLSKIYGLLELARITGHKDLKTLNEVYYQPKIEDLADKLD